MKRLKCWLDGHIYVIVRDMQSMVMDLEQQEFVICLRCLRPSRPPLLGVPTDPPRPPRPAPLPNPGVKDGAP